MHLKGLNSASQTKLKPGIVRVWYLKYTLLYVGQAHVIILTSASQTLMCVGLGVPRSSRADILHDDITGPWIIVRVACSPTVLSLGLQN